MKYADLALLFGLDPIAKASDIQSLGIYRSRLPISRFNEIMVNLRIAEYHVGGGSEHDNAAARCSYLNALFGSIVSFFQKCITHRPDQSFVGSHGQVKQQYLALDSIIIVFVEIEHQLIVGSGGLTQLAQVMVEGDGTVTRYLCELVSGS